MGTNTQFLEHESILGRSTYEAVVKPQLKPEDDGKYVAVDINTGDFEVDCDDYTASRKLLNRNPESRIWLFCSGEVATYRIGQFPNL